MTEVPVRSWSSGKTSRNVTFCDSLHIRQLVATIRERSPRSSRKGMTTKCGRTAKLILCQVNEMKLVYSFMSFKTKYKIELFAAYFQQFELKKSLAEFHLTRTFRKKKQKAKNKKILSVSCKLYFRNFISSSMRSFWVSAGRKEMMVKKTHPHTSPLHFIHY